MRQIVSIAARPATHLVLPPPSEVGNNVVAGCVLTSAAKVINNVTDPLSTPDVKLQFEELLRNAGDPDGTHQQSIACATIVYHSSRMEAVCYSSFTRRSRDIPSFHRHGKRLIILWQSSCQKRSQVGILPFRTGGKSRVNIPGDHQRLALLPPHDVSEEYSLVPIVTKGLELARTSGVQTPPNW